MTAPDPNALLSVRDVSVKYHGVHALNKTSIDLFPNEIVALMGPNGAGKSTLLKSIFGMAPLDSGSVYWRGKAVDPDPSQLIASGLAFVPQGKRVFPTLTVLENLEMGGMILNNSRLLKERIEKVLVIFPVLKQKLNQPGGKLSGGQQQTLALARALILDPQVLLLDEPTVGLSPIMVKEVFNQIQKIHNEHQTTVLIVEHNLKSLMHLVNRAYLLEKGRILASGPAAEIMQSPIFKTAFLGKEAE
jgi:branched-chain amino acid transport system ATP-binding protein